jgi:hypothetical protein
MRRLHRIALGAVALEALGAAYSFALLPRLRRWGATADEVDRALPGDDLVAEPVHVATHAITVAAAAEDVFPWVVQIGQNRGGFYSYDLLENLMHLDIHSAGEIRPEWQDLRPGEDYMALDPDGYMKLTVVTLDAPHAFVVRSGAPGEPPQPPGDFFKGEIDCSWAFIVEPLDARTSRLIIRWRAGWRRTVPAAFARAFMLEPVHFLMEERMLRGIRERAERAAAE